MDSATHRPWLTSTPADWPGACKSLESRIRSRTDTERADDEIIGTELRRLAGFDLGLIEIRRLSRLISYLGATPFTPPHFRRFHLGIVAAGTLAPLIDALPAVAAARGLLVTCSVAPYDNLGSFAWSNENPFAGIALDALLVVPDTQTFPHSHRLRDDAAETTAIEAAESFLTRLIESVRQKTTCPAILATIPLCELGIGSADRAVAGSALRFIANVNERIFEHGHRGDAIVWDIAGLAADIGHARWFDPVRHFQAKLPFAYELAPRVASSLAGVLAAMSGKSARAIVLDLDNTLWGGEIGDDGVGGIQLGQNSALGEAFVAFQRFVLDLRERGVVIAICSKNDDAIARKPFRNHPEMLLREEHVAVFQANWLDKATNIRSIAETLNLGLESLVFIDDNPAERSRVRQELPLVQVPEIGDDPAWYIRRIRDSGAFDHLPPTDDDLVRADAYGAEAKRAQVRAKIGNYDDYLASLQMRLTVRPFDETGRARIAQLINKSNQFNLTTRRYNEEDVRRMAADPSLLCWQASLDDTFGAHGTIAVVIVRRATDEGISEEWIIDTWLQSCRVLERGVEQALMNLLVTEARLAGVPRLSGEYIATPRNGMVRDFYPKLGFVAADQRGSEDRALYFLETNTAPSHRVFMDIARG